MSKAIADIATERQRQIDMERWTPGHDDRHDKGELALAAACYASPQLLYVEDRRATSVIYRDPWPWNDVFDKRPHHGNTLMDNDGVTDEARRKQLIKAGALIVAEIERLDRAAEMTQ